MEVSIKFRQNLLQIILKPFTVKTPAETPTVNSPPADSIKHIKRPQVITSIVVSYKKREFFPVVNQEFSCTLRRGGDIG